MSRRWGARSGSSAAGNGCAAWASRRNGPVPARPAPILRRRRRSKRGACRRRRRGKAAHPAATVGSGPRTSTGSGLLPVVRRVWAPKGQRPIAPVRAHVRLALRLWLCAPQHGAELVVPAADGNRPGHARWRWPPSPATRASMPTHRAVLVVDQAGWHTSPKLAVPEGIDLVFCRPTPRNCSRPNGCGPWSMSRSPTAPSPIWIPWRAVLVARCRTLEADPDRLQAHTHYHWWPAEPPQDAHQ